MSEVEEIVTALQEAADPEKAAFYPRFFRTGPGEYGEGDRFFGVTVPRQRKIARRFRQCERTTLRALLDHEVHEVRLVALFILVEQYQRARSERERRGIVDLYLEKLDRVNNWDLVDASAHKLLGAQLAAGSFRTAVGELEDLARSGHLWRQRIAMIATLAFLQQEEPELRPTLRIARRLLDHEHDLIHKAVGWMLRELGKRDEPRLLEFLREHYDRLPRTTLRYAIEKLPEERRKAALRGEL